uniref:Uncharacterized protein LOC109506062 n=1 Tax=Elaeis guineensis var. tenera TaxID=51953 RepID=A0A8N4F172_ELAGV|nr:uncharacterized protein LOC109506062 [Elaeis guineensis]
MLTQFELVWNCCIHLHYISKINLHVLLLFASLQKTCKPYVMYIACLPADLYLISCYFVCTILQMIDDQDLGFFANFLGLCIFILVITYHYVMADPKYEGN